MLSQSCDATHVHVSFAVSFPFSFFLNITLPFFTFSHPPPFPFRRCAIFSLKRQYVVTVPHLLGPTVLANNVGPKLILSFGALSFLCHTDNCQNSDVVMLQDWRKGRLVKRRAAPRLGNHLLLSTLYSVGFTLRRITCITITGNFIVQRLALAILLPGDLTRNRTISQTLYQSVVPQKELFSFSGIFLIFGSFQSH